MKVGYLCSGGHLTVGQKPEGLQGGMVERIRCINCDEEAQLCDEFSLKESVPAHFEFYRPLGVRTQEEDNLITHGYLPLRYVEDPVLIKELQATEAMLKIASFLVQKVSEKDRLPDIADTAIFYLNKYFEERQGHKCLPTDFDKFLN